jgi:hypothetical protein
VRESVAGGPSRSLPSTFWAQSDDIRSTASRAPSICSIGTILPPRPGAARAGGRSGGQGWPVFGHRFTGAQRTVAALAARFARSAARCLLRLASRHQDAAHREAIKDPQPRCNIEDDQGRYCFRAQWLGNRRAVLRAER